MATWKLSPQYKKSAVEKMFFYKDGKCITIEQGFRWATFSVDSDERPLTDEELKNEDGYELGSIANDESWEMWDMIDGCWVDIEAYNGSVSEEEQQAFEQAWEEDSYCGVEELGWSNDDTEYYYHGPLELTNEDTGEVFKGEPDEETPEVVSEVPEALEDFTAEVTDWFPTSTHPVRNGNYEVLTLESANWPFPQFCTWDGNKWETTETVTEWRGLANNPEGTT